MLTDTHCHLASHKFPPEEIPTLLQRAHDAGVTQLITLATGLDDLQANLVLAHNHPSVHCCLGIHPCDVHETSDDFATTLAPLLNEPKVAAVGETGLDYYHPAPDGWTDDSLRSRQREFLEQHFRLAAGAGLNLVIHTRDRSGDASLRDAVAIYRNHASSVRAVFHCFISTYENARTVLDLGGLVSFGGVATFRNAREVLDLTTRLPKASFMLETDSPYLAPHPHRGTRNEPARIREIAEAIADARGESVAELADHTGAAAISFFRGIE